MAIEVNYPKQKMSHIANQKITYVKNLDGNAESLSQLEELILNRFLNEAIDDKMSLQDFKNLVDTDYNQEMQAIVEKTEEIRRMGATKKRKLDTNS